MISMFNGAMKLNKQYEALRLNSRSGNDMSVDIGTNYHLKLE